MDSLYRSKGNDFSKIIIENYVKSSIFVLKKCIKIERRNYSKKIILKKLYNRLLMRLVIILNIAIFAGMT